MLRALIGCALTVVALAAGHAQAEYPDRAIKMIVAWPPGGGADNAARLLGDRLSKRLGQPVVIENRAGANGMIGTTAGAKSPADGYTIVFATADTHSINPHVYKQIQYDAMKDFEPVSLLGTVSFVLISSSKFEPSTLNELIAFAKRNPGKVSYATWGVGSTAHLAMASFELASGVELLHVPYQGSGPAINALLGGQIDLYMAGATGADQYRKTGRAKVFGIAGTKRSSGAMADVKTLAEQNVPGAEGGGWYGIVTPTGVPKAIRDRLTAEIVAIMKSPDVSQKLVETGWEVVAGGQDELAALMRSEYDRYGKIVRAKKISVEQ